LLFPKRRLRSRICTLLGTFASIALLAHGGAVQAQADDGPSIIRDTEIEEILHEDADPIFTAAGLDAKSVHLHLVEDRELNAFATQGLEMFVFSGLIVETKNPNELVGVMAHETGHIAGGHAFRSGDAGKAALAPFLLSLGLGILAAAAGHGDAAGALVYSGGYFAELSVLGYSREQESRADQAAVTFLERAHMSGRGLVDFFDEFRYQEVFSDEKKFPFFRDHPLSADRIEALRVRVQEQPHFGVVDSPEALAKHAIMVAKLKGFTQGVGQTLNDYPETDTSFPARYARAIAYYRATDTETALKAIDGLLKDYPNNPYLWELKGQVLFEVGRIEESEAPHRRSVELKPDAPLLRINLAQTLVAENQRKKLDEAVVHLQRALSVEPDDALAWRILSEAYDARGDAGLARLATAEQNFYLGQMNDARSFAVRAREFLHKDTPEWRRATDIILATHPTKEQAKDLQSP
jgi:predicted Zn-dependent protease